MDNVIAVFVLDSVCVFVCHHINPIKGLMSPCSCVYSEDRDREVDVCFALSIQNPNKSYRRPLILHHPAPVRPDLMVQG